MPDIVWIWLVAFVIFLILEVLTPSMLFIGFSISALVSSIFAFFYPESYYWQIGIFIVVASILLPLTRKMVKKITKDSPQTANVDALIGKIGIVLKDIKPNNAGQLQVDGQVWRAQSDEVILKDTKAIVLKVTGTTVYVEKKS